MSICQVTLFERCVLNREPYRIHSDIFMFLEPGSYFGSKFVTRLVPCTTAVECLTLRTAACDLTERDLTSVGDRIRTNSMGWA